MSLGISCWRPTILTETLCDRVNSIAQTSIYQLRKTNVRVNSICPGLIETGMTGATFDYARQRGTANKIGQLNPMGRYAVAEEVAQVALFLASGKNTSITFSNLLVCILT
jgi:NAD(P)-dependent dehydrogenase (short-subunit alcohol dehydrogenase family)